MPPDGPFDWDAINRWRDLVGGNLLGGYATLVYPERGKHINDQPEGPYSDGAS